MWERWPDAGRRAAGSGRVARARGPAGAHPPARARGTGVHRPAKGTFATFERARAGRGRGGDPASGASSACPAQPGRMAAAQRNAGAGEERRGRGAGAPPTGGASRSWGVMERCSWPHGNSPGTPVLRGRGGGRVKGISGIGQLDWEMPRVPNCLSRGPSGDPGRKPSGAQAWREPPGRDEELSRSSEPLAPRPVQGALSSLVGEERDCPLPRPQLLSPA